MRSAIAAAVFVLAAASAAAAHDGAAHATGAETGAVTGPMTGSVAAETGPAEATSSASTPPALPFPVAITPKFTLIDQTGRTVTPADFAGRPMAIFFGYANCPGVCPVALAHLGDALDILGARGGTIAPILITVDPDRDTPDAMSEALPKYHPRLIGLTGSEAALAEARAAFQVDTRQITEAPDGGAIFAHGGFIYLFGGDGTLQTILPPNLPSERLAELMAKYL